MDEWLAVAKKLPSGRQVRWTHCGNSEAAVLFNSPTGYSIYCHRCGYKWTYPKGYQSFEELMKIREVDTAASAFIEQSTVRLPPDFTPDIPPEGMIWLLKAAITPHAAKQAGFGWIPQFNRVVLPVYDEDRHLVYYQARAVLHGQEPKYLNPKVDRASILYWTKHSTDTRTVILTEDILSALRVSRATGIVCASVLGTKITTQQAGKLSKYENIILWLDSDKAGVEGARKLRRTLGLVSNIMQIVTKLDPKRLPDRTIIKQLNNLGDKHGINYFKDISRKTNW